jgi:hypothetical protein
VRFACNFQVFFCFVLKGHAISKLFRNKNKNLLFPKKKTKESTKNNKVKKCFKNKIFGHLFTYF